jgi:uncharacterized ion transporter superfamily protein YfcC
MIIEKINKLRKQILIIFVVLLIVFTGKYIYKVQTENEKREDDYNNAIKAKEELIQILKNNNPEEGKLKYEEI